MRQRSRTIAALGAIAALGLGTTAVLTTPANAAALENKALGLSSNGRSLGIYDLANGSLVNSVPAVTGLVGGDTKLIGIDFRPANRKFYGVGNTGNIYIINYKTGAATKVSELSVELEGTNFGVDFNPAADRLRIVSDTGQNLRHPVQTPNGPTVVDGTLTNPTTPSPTTATGITAVAYTNSDNQPGSGTVLYDIDTTLDQLDVQAPANAGTLGFVGKLGTNADAVAGFDILSRLNSAGVATSNVGYAVLRATPNEKAKLYKIDLTSGVVTRLGSFTKSVVDIAIRQPVSPLPPAA